jgi:SAM-dependent methyltransferase
MLYIAADRDPLHVHALRNRFLRTPNVVVQHIDSETGAGFADLENSVDTALCIDLLEDTEDPDRALQLLAAALKPGGRIVVLVPNLPALFGTLDQNLGHKRRYNAASLQRLLATHGFTVDRVEGFNKVALLPWWAYSKILGSGRISKLVLKIFDKSVWILRRLDALIPWPGLSLLVVGHKAGIPNPQSRQSPAETTQNVG